MTPAGSEAVRVAREHRYLISKTDGVDGSTFYNWLCDQWQGVMFGTQSLQEFRGKCVDVFSAITRPCDVVHGLPIRRKS